MYDKPLSLVPVCLPWQALLSPAGRTKFSLYYENSFVDVKKKKEKKDRKEKQNNHPGADHSSYSEWEHERGFALT